MVGKVRLIGMTVQFSFFSVFTYFLGVVKNYLYLHVMSSPALSLFLYLHVVSSPASSLFLTYEPR